MVRPAKAPILALVEKSFGPGTLRRTEPVDEAPDINSVTELNL